MSKKYEWIDPNASLPESDASEVMAWIKGDNDIYIGTFCAGEIYEIDASDQSVKNYKKIVNFTPSLWVFPLSCAACNVDKECIDQCYSCCESDHDLGLRRPIFNITQVGGWSYLPEIPKEKAFVKI